MALGTTRLLLPLLLGFVGTLRGETDLEKASRLIKAKQFSEAQVILERTLQSNPRSADALGLMGEVQLANDQPQMAIEYADKAIQLNPGKARFHLLRGNALGVRINQVGMLRKLSMSRDILGSFEKAVQLEPGYRDARLQLFNFYYLVPGMAGGSLEKAKIVADQTVPLDPSRGHYMKGLLRQKEKDPGAAQAEYRLALAADAQFALVYNALGYVELEMKQVDPALEHFQKQAELAPDNANSFDSLGDGWMAKGRLDEAIASYRRALALNPLFTASMRSLGKALEQAGRRDEAIQHYRQCGQLGVQKGIPQLVTQSKDRLKALGVHE